ncbi:MAG: His-Xaa-Ser system radical SAM maturase HxsB [Deltaproteobacteria bacterium]|jgi:His-Xaa-Ser system radical SAM maturase HxsB|nr:His-Xaa-Ser system radical SAM maturase HxsB [Deltaproteobacteria bacterium]
MTLLPFSFDKISDDTFLLVNCCGDFYFVNQRTLELLCNESLDRNHPDYLNLLSRLFISEGPLHFTIQKLAAKYRTKMSFLRDFTTLHMLVITLRCNQKCDYCQVSCEGEEALRYDMEINTAKKIIDTILLAPSNRIKIEFQGGEPTLNWDTLKESVLYAEEQNKIINKKLEFVLCTNLTAINENQLNFCAEHNIDISTSLDGPLEIHDKHRKSRNTFSTYQQFINNLELAKKIVGIQNISPLMTTTSFSLNNIETVIDEYIRLGFKGIFIRSLNPYGFAAQQNELLGYSSYQFVKAYLNALRYIIELNIQKNIFFQEYFATILFTRILTSFPTGFVDLQSPAGVGICGVIYDYNGDVYPSDEARMLARMGDKYFKIGNVFEDSYSQIFNSEKLKHLIRNSCNEIIPTCFNCVYRIYCGTDPIRNYLESGSIIRDMFNTPFCIKHKNIFKGIFQLLHTLTEKEDDVIWNWIIPKSLPAECVS